MPSDSSAKDLGEFVSEPSPQCVHHEISRQRERAHGLLCTATPDVRGTAGRPVRGSLPTLSLLQRSYPTSGFNIYILHLHFLSLACIPVLPQKRQSLEADQAPANRSLSWCDNICSSRLAEDVWEMQKAEVLWSQARQHPAQPSPAILLSWERNSVLHVLAVPAKTL